MAGLLLKMLQWLTIKMHRIMLTVMLQIKIELPKITTEEMLVIQRVTIAQEEEETTKRERMAQVMLVR